ncbi:MAG TPA: sugar porter family MFS transporter, partial [Ktedonobacteraceae bacterium]
LIILSIVFTLGALLTAFSPNFWSFILFRIIVGLGVGAAASVVPVYISEMSPSAVRGKLVTFNQLAITIGIAVSYWVDLAFAAGGYDWRPMFAAAAVPGILLFLGMIASLETPRWLASKGRWDDAHNVLTRIKGANPDEELAGIRTALLEERVQAGVKELFKPGLRMALLVGVGLAVFQQFVGINTVIYYAPTIFQAAGVASASAAIFATSIVGVVNVASTILSLFLVDRAGRRVLLLIGIVGMIIGLICMGAVFAVGPTSAAGLILASLILYIFSFAISLGTVFWLMSAELFPTRVRAVGASICAFSNWVSNFLVSVTFLTLVNGIGRPMTFWLYAIMGALAFVFCFSLVPETKGKTLEQIEYYWLHGRRWKGAPPDVTRREPAL